MAKKKGRLDGYDAGTSPWPTNGGISVPASNHLRHIYNEKFGKNNSGSSAGIQELRPDEHKPQTEAFRKCMVPWVGGLSGSILERMLYIHQKDANALTDEVVLVLMAAFQLNSNHGLAELAIVAQAACKELNACPGIAELSLPMDMGGNCLLGGMPGFLMALEDVIEKVLSAKASVPTASAVQTEEMGERTIPGFFI